MVEDRANQVLNTIGAPALESVYQSIDPWKSLKTAAQDRVRLVLPEELKAARAKGKPKPGRKAASEGDPWDLDDPWKQGRQLSSSSERPPVEQLQIVIEQGFFLDEEDAPLPVIPHVSAEAKGVAVMSVEEAQTFAQADFVLSEDELGAIVVGNVQPSTHGKHCESVTFPAKHGVQRILLKGFLLQLGTKRVKTQKAQVSIDMPTEEVMVLAVEIRREYTPQWEVVTRNPLKYAFSAIDGLQRAVISTWARKYFQGRQASSPGEATTWHCYAKVPSAGVETILQLSGKNSTFLTPKQDATGTSSGYYRVIWLETTNLEQAAAVHRVHSELLGIVRGRATLGVRTRACDYAAVRKRLDPAWSSQGVLTDIVVCRRWRITPVPPRADKKQLQEALNKMNWRAVPLKQVSATTWLIGAALEDEPPKKTIEIAGSPILIVEQFSRKQAAKEDKVIAGSSPLRKTFNHQFARQLPVAAPMPPTSQDANMVPATQARGPASAMMVEMREDLNGRLQDLQERLQSAVNEINKKVLDVESQVDATNMEVADTMKSQEVRLQKVEYGMQTISSAMVTKNDLAQALKEAFESQSRDLRSMLSKRSPHATPTGEAKASRLS